MKIGQQIKAAQVQVIENIRGWWWQICFYGCADGIF